MFFRHQQGLGYPGFSSGMEDVVWENPDTPVSASDYVLVDGKRFVLPYFFEFIAHVKKRWSGKTIVDLFADEFRQRPYGYYVEAVESGRILVDDKKCDKSYRVRTTQKLSHFVHRHEPPVVASSTIILEDGPEVLTVHKPASVPVHTCGQYRKNTVIGILQAENTTGPLFPVHRLDRLVSGLLIFAKNASKADKFRKDIEHGHVRKLYVAKVKGVFSEKEVVVNAPVVYDPREGVSTVGVATFVDQPIVKGKEEKEEDAAAKSKEACTKFLRLSTDGVYSLVQCEPLTGRTHQIRVHLQHIGHPIANDALYLHSNPPKRSKKGGTADSAARIVDASLQSPKGKEEPVECENGGEKAKQVFRIDPLCTNCPNLGPSGYEDESEGLWLHCVQYSSDDWSYECPLPNWAV